MKISHVTLLGGALLIAHLAAACGGSQANAKLDTPDEVATGDAPTTFQKKRLLGHYSTHDGGSGFILDRTAMPWRAKLDGVDKVHDLDESPGPRDMKEYRAPDKSIWLRIHDDGTVVLFQGPKQRFGVEVVRDADAKSLR